MSTTTTATVTGMHCASCAMGIETFLSSQDEIRRATVEYETNQITIAHTETLDLGTVWQRIDEMGYQVKEAES
jgi:copper chaperone CopZ